MPLHLAGKKLAPVSVCRLARPWKGSHWERSTPPAAPGTGLMMDLSQVPGIQACKGISNNPPSFISASDALVLPHTGNKQPWVLKNSSPHLQSQVSSEQVQ